MMKIIIINNNHILLLTNAQVSKLHKAFANGSSANIKLSKTELHKTGQSVGILGPLLKTVLPLIRNLLKPLAKSALIPLGLTTPAATTNAAIHKNMFGSGTRTSIISHEPMNDIMKIIKSLEESGLLIKGVSKTIKNEAKGGFLGMLSGTVGASLLGNLLTGKGTIRAGEGTIRADQDF